MKPTVPVPTLACWHPYNFYRHTTFIVCFVLSDKYRYRRKPHPTKQLFKGIGDNSIAAFSQLFLTSTGNINYVLRITNDREQLGHGINLPCPVQFFLE